ncbi:MAG: hypothetical protein ABI395_09910 [Sphingobium sp.]
MPTQIPTIIRAAAVGRHNPRLPETRNFSDPYKGADSKYQQMYQLPPQPLVNCEQLAAAPRWQNHPKK